MTKKTISERRLNANRANARKSTGPKTAEGKAIASRNATKHGLLAQHLILDDDPVETATDFHALLNSLIHSLKPQGPFEYLLVERVAVCYWRLARAARFEMRAIRVAREEEHSAWAELQRSVTGKPVDPARHIIPREHSLECLIRYEGLIDRELQRALNQLYRCRTNHLSQLPAPENPPSSPAAPPDPAEKKILPNEATKTAFSTPPTPTEVPNP